ncbi:MAG: hypothetical protein R3C28_28585 [Pirellulaceae bacterium]
MSAPLPADWPYPPDFPRYYGAHCLREAFTDTDGEFVKHFQALIKHQYEKCSSMLSDPKVMTPNFDEWIDSVNDIIPGFAGRFRSLIQSDANFPGRDLVAWFPSGPTIDECKSWGIICRISDLGDVEQLNADDDNTKDLYLDLYNADDDSFIDDVEIDHYSVELAPERDSSPFHPSPGTTPDSKLFQADGLSYNLNMYLTVSDGRSEYSHQLDSLPGRIDNRIPPTECPTTILKAASPTLLSEHDICEVSYSKIYRQLMKVIPRWSPWIEEHDCKLRFDHQRPRYIRDTNKPTQLLSIESRKTSWPTLPTYRLRWTEPNDRRHNKNFYTEDIVLDVIVTPIEAYLCVESDDGFWTDESSLEDKMLAFMNKWRHASTCPPTSLPNENFCFGTSCADAVRFIDDLYRKGLTTAAVKDGIVTISKPENGHYVVCHEYDSRVQRRYIHVEADGIYKLGSDEFREYNEAISFNEQYFTGLDWLLKQVIAANS